MRIHEAYVMGCKPLKQIMMIEYCPQQDVQALEQEH